MRNVVFLMILTAFTGCKLDVLTLASTSPVGHYSLDMTSTTESIKSQALAEAQKVPGTPEEIQQRAEELQKTTLAILSTMTATMAIKEDGTWESVFGWGGGVQMTSRGTWEQKDETLLLTTVQEEGQQSPKPKVGEAVYKNDKIYLTNKGADLNNAFVLTRSST